MAGVAARAAGFSLVELLAAMSLLLVVMSAVFGVVHPAGGAFRAEPERADVEQRLRAAVDALTRDLVGAGAGVSQGLQPGPLTDALPPVLPFRQGRRSPDAPGLFRADTVTLLRVVGSTAQATAAAPFPAQSTQVPVALGPGCPTGDAACGFRRGMSVVAFDGTGAFDTFTVTAVAGATLTLQHNMRDSSKVYPAGRTILAEALSRTYYLHTDAASDTYQLRQYDGGGGNDVPVVDHVVSATFEYYGDPYPPTLLEPLTDEPGPRTTYGPSPTRADGNCLFAADGTVRPPPLLPALGSGEALVPLPESGLTDGPWCPNASSPNRYDADLFRVRTIVVRLCVEASERSLRGPAGTLFTRGGTSTGGHAMVPDREVRLRVAPPNLAPRGATR